MFHRPRANGVSARGQEQWEAGIVGIGAIIMDGKRRDRIALPAPAHCKVHRVVGITMMLIKSCIEHIVRHQPETIGDVIGYDRTAGNVHIGVWRIRFDDMVV